MENNKEKEVSSSPIERALSFSELRRVEPKQREVLYPPVVIAHITKDITDLFVPRIADKTEIQMHYSAQMNSHPHLGTVLSLMTAFALGEKLSTRFGIPTKLKFEVLENAPGERIEVNGRVYTKMLCDTLKDGVPLSDIYLESFKDLLSMLSKQTGIKVEYLTYKQFQELPFVRQTLITILNREEEFKPIIAPSEDHLRVRFPCPKCRFEEKGGETTTIKKIDNSHLFLESECFQHGKHQILLAPENKDFVDINTPLRNVIKEALFIEEARVKNGLDVMVDGGDWVSMVEFVVSEGLARLGYSYKDRPVRVFTPIIEDWSGAKLSKSVYVEKGKYEYLPDGFLNFVRFKEQFGEEGIEKLWNEVCSWVEEPKKLLRNYTAEYFLQLLRI
jgi:extradiol dioxygenase family protein